MDDYWEVHDNNLASIQLKIILVVFHATWLLQILKKLWYSKRDYAMAKKTIGVENVGG